MNLELEKKVGLILGGSKGIGLAIAKGLAAEGVDVCVVSRSIENLTSAQAHIVSSTSVKVAIYQADAGNSNDLSALYENFLINLIGLIKCWLNAASQTLSS